MVLRDLGPADVAPFVRAFAEDPDLRRDLGHEDEPGRTEVRRILRTEARRRERGERVNLAMADPADDAFLGNFAVHSINWVHRRADIGFFVVPTGRGRGVATESVRLVTRWLIADLGFDRVGMMTAPWNLATMRLAERAGFTHEGVLRSYTLERGVRVDNVAYSILRHEL